MRAFEAYRAARKMGWSRPWNKYDLINFQSFRLRPREDRGLIDLARRVVLDEFRPLPDEASAYLDDLLPDQELMGFVFCHEYRREGRLWEGATLSLGRKVEGRYRDRLDIILESELRDGESQGLGRVRIYLDPYQGKPGPPRWEMTREDRLGEACHALFAELSEISWTWFDDAERRWDHWTSRYIDYFGERQHAPRHSYFHLPGHGEGRIDATAGVRTSP
jgi:hypothetical protein